MAAILALSAWGYCAPLQAAAAGESALQHFLDGLDTFSAAFEQKQFNEHGEETETANGVLYVSRPGKFQWDYWEPYSQLIVCDGSNLWIYDEDLEQVTVKDVTSSLDDSPAAILGGDVDVDRYYVVIDKGVEDGVDWLELTPRDVDSQYRSVQLGFRDGQLAGMVLFDNLGQTTRISFQDVKRNPTLAPKLFQFKPPDGVDVIDSRAGAAPGKH